MQTAINAAAGELPEDMPTPPTYHLTNPADARILLLGLTSDTHAVFSHSYVGPPWQPAPSVITARAAMRMVEMRICISR